MNHPNDNNRLSPSRLRPVLAAAGLLALVGTIAGQESAPWRAPERAAKRPNPVAANGKTLALGRQLYAKHCLSCHGTRGFGDGPQAKDLDRRVEAITSDRLGSQSDGALFWKISSGKKPMPSFETLATPEERWSIINYVRTLKPKQ